MEHGGVLVESGRARRASPDPRPHGGGCCSGTGDSRSSRGAARVVWHSAIAHTIVEGSA